MSTGKTQAAKARENVKIDENPSSSMNPRSLGFKGRFTEEWWGTEAAKNFKRCTAHRRNGDLCKHAAMNGSAVCQTHGGRAPQVRAKAQRRLAEATDTMARALLKMATDDNVADSVKLTAIRDALDRGGVVAKTAVEVGVSVKPFEAIIDRMDSGSRADFRRSMGIEEPDEPDQTALPLCEYDDDLILNDYDQDDGYPMTSGDWERGAVDDSGPFGGPLGPNGPAGSGMLPLDAAVAAQQEMRKHAVLRPAQRALPRGRT